MFLSTFTDAVKLIYVRTKDHLFWNLRPRVFDFLEKREKWTPDTFFLSQEANRAPATKKTNIYSICHHDMKEVCYQKFHNSTSLGEGTVVMLSNLSRQAGG